MLIPNCTSGKDVYIFTTDTLDRGSGTVGPIIWLNPPRLGASVVLCVYYQ